MRIKNILIFAVMALIAGLPMCAKAETVTSTAAGTATTTVTSSLPDLMVTSTGLTMNKKTVKGGDSVILKAYIKNIGSLKAANFKIRFLLNGLKIFEKTISFLAKSAGMTQQFSYLLPPNMYGPQTFSALLDPEQLMAELREDNNSAEKIITVDKAQRDLYFEFVKPAPLKPRVGQQVTWTIKVRNAGNAAVQNVKVFFYADNTSDMPTATYTIKSLSAKAATVKSIKWTVPADIGTATGYSVRATVDPDNQYDETNEANNTKIYNLSLTAPDLSMEYDSNSLTKNWPIYKGVTMAQWGKVRNDNVLPVSNVKAGLYYYIGSDITNQVKLAEQNLGTLAKKAAVSFQLSGRLPDSLPLGTLIHEIIKVDADNSIVETNENNNSLEVVRTLTEKPRQVQYPYMRVSVYDEDGNPKNGVVVKITNTASGAVETKTTGVDNFYDSNGNVIFESRPDTANYLIEVSAAGYRAVSQTVPFDRYNDATWERQIYLDKKALLTGTVTGPGGQALSGVKVRVIGLDLEATTDNLGKYGFLLNGGTYTLHFVKSGYTRIIETDKVIAPVSDNVLNKTMTAASVGYVTGAITDDDGAPLVNADIWVNGNLIRVTGSAGTFDFTPSPGSKKITIKKPGYVTIEFNQDVVAGEEYNFTLSMYKPSTDSHAERGANIVSWHQHEGTPANAFFIPEYNVDIWWGLGRIKMGLDYSKSDSGTKATKLTVQVKGLSWDCYRVQGDAEVETSAIDIPITISAGDCSDKQTQIDVYKVAIYSDGQEIWSSPGFWTSASDPMNVTTKVYTLNNLQISWNSDLKVKVWARVQKKAVIGTEGDGSGALSGYHLDKKLITWSPQKPPTTKISTSWSQIGGYFLGILDNPVNIVAGFTDIFTVEQFDQFNMEEVLPENFPS